MLPELLIAGAVAVLAAAIAWQSFVGREKRRATAQTLVALAAELRDQSTAAATLALHSDAILARHPWIERADLERLREDATLYVMLLSSALRAELDAGLPEAKRWLGHSGLTNEQRRLLNQLFTDLTGRRASRDRWTDPEDPVTVVVVQHFERGRSSESKQTRGAPAA